MGGLHIEMAMFAVLGEWLDGSGWAFVMTSANVTTEGRALGLQKGSHTSRSLLAHQVTAAALSILLRNSYREYYSTTTDVEKLQMEDWCEKMACDHPQFHYWYEVMKLELLYLQFLKSQREQQFVPYLESLGKIIPWMFALDHYHYARWMTVHVADLVNLKHTSPDTHIQFLNGNFVAQKTSNRFSALTHDQVHEQLNAMVKGDGGVIGITENEAALLRWMVDGPETARLLNEYNEKHSRIKNENGRHHEQIPSIQKNFLAHVKNVIEVIDGLGNPFSDTSIDLYTLDNKIIMPDNVIDAIRTAEDIGQTQYHKFANERIKDNTTAFNDSIHTNNLHLFNCNSRKISTKSKSKIVNLQNDVFSRMYISCQSRDSNMDTFFAHENHAWPPSLATNSIMHQTTKSDLLPCLKLLIPQQKDVPNVQVKLIDGAALVHTLDPKRVTTTVKTFRDYCQLVFLPYLGHMLQGVERIDIVWDVYKADSLKTQTRKNRGDGNQLVVAANTNIPGNWTNFLRVDTNKTALFQLLANAVKEFTCPEGKQLISTHGKYAVLSPMADLTNLCCDHEEADTRLLFHASITFGSLWVYQTDDTCNRHRYCGSRNSYVECITEY